MPQLTQNSKAYSSFRSVGLSSVILLIFLISWVYFLAVIASPYKFLVGILGGLLFLFIGSQTVLLALSVSKRNKAFQQGVGGEAVIIELKARYGAVGRCRLELVHNSKKYQIEDKFISTLYSKLEVGKSVSVRFLPEDPNTFIITNL